MLENLSIQRYSFLKSDFKNSDNPFGADNQQETDFRLTL